MTDDLPIIQKTYDLIKWYIPELQNLPRSHRFQLGDRVATSLYDFLENLIAARYQRDKLEQLQALNGKLNVLRYQTRLLADFDLLSTRRYVHAAELLTTIGNDLGGWIKQQDSHRKALRA